MWGRVEVYTGLWWGNLKERDHLEDPGVDGRMDLQEVGCEVIDWIDLAQGTQVADSCKCGNEPSDYIKCRVYTE